MRAGYVVAAETTRVVAVLGYSRRGDAVIHDICLQRLRRAESVSLPTDAVILSGRGRGSGGSEGALMAAAWQGSAVALVPETESRSTVGNARAVARYANDVGADEVVVITSSWHRPRAALLFKSALRGRGTRVRVVAPERTWPVGPVVREAVCLLVLPVQPARTLRRGKA